MEAYIYDAVRSPRGKGKSDGALHEIPPIELATQILRSIPARTGIDTADVDDVILGCVTPVGEQGADIARVAVLNADYAESVPGVQINRFCASGLEAVPVCAVGTLDQLRPRVLAGRAELRLDEPAILAADDVNRPVPIRLWIPNVVMHLDDLPALLSGYPVDDVIDGSLVGQDGAASSDVLHARELHVLMAAELVDDRADPLQTLHGLGV